MYRFPSDYFLEAWPCQGQGNKQNKVSIVLWPWPLHGIIAQSQDLQARWEGVAPYIFAPDASLASP